MLRELDEDLWVVERPQRFLGLEVEVETEAGERLKRTGC